jgi:hypothetical protein
MARALGDVEQHEDAAGDRDVSHVEGRPPGQLDEVGHGAVADAIDDVAQGAAEEHPGRQPHERLVEVRDEVGHQGHQRGAHDDRDDRPAAGEAAEGDPLVADVHDLHAREDAVLVAGRDVRANDRLGRLVEGDDHRRHRGGTQPRRHQPAMRL